MPYRKKNYVRRKRKNFRRKKYQPRVTNVTKSVSGAFPHAIVSKLRFCDPVLLDPSLGGVAHYTYRANSVYDPAVRVGGAQPRGFDEMMSLYNKFRVLGSRIKVRFINDKFAQDNANEQSITAFVGLIDETGDTPASLVEAVENRGKFTTKVLGNLQSTAFTKTIIRKFSAKKHWTNTPGMTEDVFEGGAGSDCVKQCFYTVGCGNWDLTENARACHAIVEIDYIVKFYQPRVLPQS